MVIERKHYQLKNVLLKLDHGFKDTINNLKKCGIWKI